jgi:cytochrome o ubiquinol oxidase subunit IV
MSKNTGKDVQLEIRQGLKQYVIGFILSIVFTVLSKFVMLSWLSLFACAQVFVQLYYFMHLADEEKPRYTLLSMIFFVIMVCIISLGSIVIMYATRAAH